MQKENAFREGTRKYNRAIRKQLGEIIYSLQDKTLNQFKEELGIEHIPSSTFNSSNYLQQNFDSLQLLARACQNPEDFFNKVEDYFKNNIQDIVLYDLFINIQKYSLLNTTGSQYLFFHELNKSNDTGSEAYPIFFLEVDISRGTDDVIISFPRDLLFINTPAVNYFRFPSILTIPRSSTFQKVSDDLAGMEVFLQSQYNWGEPFVLEPQFKKIKALKDEYPDMNCRVGFQVVQRENKKLLDYSEIMTQLISGENTKFSNFISEYIDGNVENTQDRVDKEYIEKYPIKNPKRYVSDNPLNLNNSQKKILLALHHSKNKIIVVDGPPGTGKSHTIAALTYWANSEKKSIVITSHKKEALDVIDRMLTNKFKNLHPKAKPSIIRFGANGKSLNTIENSLQSAVINAAGDRANEYNENAVSKDMETSEIDILRKLEKKLSCADHYPESIRKLCAYEQIQQDLLSTATFSEIDLSLPPMPNTSLIKFGNILDFISGEKNSSLKQVDLEELNFLLKNKKDIPTFLAACEAINLHSTDHTDADIQSSDVPQHFVELVENCKNTFKKVIPIVSLTADDLEGAFFKKLLRKYPDKKKRESLIRSIKSLQYATIIEDLSKILGIGKNELNIDHLSHGIEELTTAISLKKHQDVIKEYRAIGSNRDKNIHDIYLTLSGITDILEKVSVDLINTISDLFHQYGKLLLKLKISKDNLYSLFRLQDLTGGEVKIWRWIKLHDALSKSSEAHTLSIHDFQDYYALKQKQVEHVNDARLKNLNNHLADIARMKVSFDGGKRFTSQQARVLLDNVSGLIAEPDMISKFFPMEEDMVDLLIIDEASQVSIANSISLMLRAKQVVIFGDEYQYGAVSAVNVNAKYSASYFKEIINAFTKDYNVHASEEETDSLIQDISKEIDDEDREIDQVIHRHDDNAGTILWLKTFNIRTSTLTFAKAIANYTTSLRDHYRSFGEIIDYSNEFFYKPTQLELIVNRIRTKPITEVLQFIHVETKGNSGKNVNLDEIDAIVQDMKDRISNGYKGTIGIITSFREQQIRMEKALAEQMNMPELKKNHQIAVWFVGDVQGEERDLIYYSFVEDKQYGNTDLKSIYPVVGGTADNIRSLKMQRLNVGFSRAKDTMAFVHSMSINDYSHTRLGDALKHYHKIYEDHVKNDFFVEDTSIFDSPAEEDLYNILIKTHFVTSNREHINIVPQFKIGEYIRAEFAKQIPKYRVDFLLTYSISGTEQSLILEYDGVEYHTKNPEIVTRHNFTQEYLDYDIHRQIELETYGYRFLRINKFTLRPEKEGESRTDVLNRLITRAFTVE